VRIEDGERHVAVVLADNPSDEALRQLADLDLDRLSAGTVLRWDAATRTWRTRS
jgi:hypothetical protein